VSRRNAILSLVKFIFHFYIIKTVFSRNQGEYINITILNNLARYAKPHTPVDIYGTTIVGENLTVVSAEFSTIS